MMNREQISAELVILVEYFADIDAGKVEFWTILAEKLSTAIGRTEPWSWRYIHSVYKNQLDPSQDLGRAIRALGAMLDGVPRAIAYTESVTVLSTPDQVRSGSLIIGSSKLCANPSCRIYFVPNSPRRKYCPACSPPKYKEHGTK